jgi:predicted RNA methylase
MVKGNTVWDGALVLASYFANEKVFPEGYWKNKSVVELGAGTGLVGLFTALLGE